MSYIENATKMELLIMDYQKENLQKNKDRIYKKICDIYTPCNYQQHWWKQYAYLYESYEDFLADYNYILVKTIGAWKPKNERGVSKYNGKGEFKNYFWSILQNHFSNIIKSKHSGKRNIKAYCPVCDKWWQSLTLHLIESHKHLLHKYIHNYTNKDIDLIEKCPFCPNLRFPHTAFNNINMFIKNHIYKQHISFLFEQFEEDYPGYLDKNKNVSLNSVYDNDGNDEEFDMLDLQICSKQNNVNILFNMDLTDIQKTILNNALASKRKIVYNKNDYDCCKEDFEKEFNDLKNKMVISGFQTEDEYIEDER